MYPRLRSGNNSKNTNTTAIIVTHDPEEAMLIAERIILMSDGKIQQDGTAENLYNNPEGRFAASFFGYVNNLSGLVKGKIIETDLGNIPNQNFKDGDNLHIIIRPQALSVSIQENPNQHEHCATIKSIRFVGTSYHIWSELYIWDGTHKQLLSIQTETGNLKKGDKIEYHVDNEKIFLYRK